MNIVFAASEMVPYAKVGGLADVSGTLIRNLESLGANVVSFLPRYKSVDPQQWNLEVAIDRLRVPLGSDKMDCRIYVHKNEKGGQVYFVDYPEYYSRDEVYGTTLGDYPDNDRRFILFNRAVLEALRDLKFKPDVIHCHDWQTGLIPVYLKTLYSEDRFFSKTKSVFTIHNLAYQGNFPPDSLPVTGLSWDLFKLDKMEFYGKISLLKGGIVFADRVTTVSERYSQEIQTKEFGCGLEGVLAERKDDLSGIVNGIDYTDWNPEVDGDIPVQYSLDTVEAKMENKRAFQRECGFNEENQRPLIGCISRLVEQKGIDLIIEAMPGILRHGADMVILGTGEEKYHQVLRKAAKQHKKNLNVRIVFDPLVAKKIYAGADMIVMPSYYEPCGLGQMIALRYGTIPVVRATGGLADTIEEYDSLTREGNGFLFKDYRADAFLEAIRKAMKVYQRQEDWMHLVRNAMQCDFSWENSARKYLNLYDSMAGKIKK